MSTEQKEGKESSGWGIHDTEIKKMDLSETEEKFEAKHQWLCNGIVLKLEDSKSKHNIALFKVNINKTFLISNVTFFSLSDCLEKMSTCDSIGNS